MPILTAFLLLGFFPCTCSGQASAAEEVQEYFVKQSTDEHLFIRINGFEAAFSSTISDQDGRELMRSGLPGTRLVPLFQYVAAPTRDRQLNIRISAPRYTSRMDFALEFTRLEVWDERSSAISRAYRMLAFGMYENPSASVADWTIKIDGLVSAGRLFQQFGMQEMRLWSNYIAAHQVLYQLHDFSIAHSMTSEILAELGSGRFQRLELAALQLQAVALAGLKRSGQLSVSSVEPNPIQAVLAKATALADRMGLSYEVANALEASGNAYSLEADYREALSQYQQAVEIADSLSDGELATQIRESMVKIHARLGDTQASTNALQKIEAQLQEKGSRDDLALNLLEQGRLQIRQFQYDQALDSLLEALSYENDSSVRRRIQFALALVFYETGRPKEALENLRSAGFDVERRRASNSNDADDAAAWWMLANIHRSQKEFKSMRQARAFQSVLMTNKAQQRYLEGSDESSVGLAPSSKARLLFEQAYRAANGNGDPVTADLSLLSHCVLAGSDSSLCRRDALEKSQGRLQRNGSPRQAMQASWLWAKILAGRGDRVDAAAVMEALVTGILFYRQVLPGVLGSWYHENHVAVFSDYIDLLTSDSSSTDGKSAFRSLRALNQVRAVEHAAGSIPEPADRGRIERVRLLLSEHEPYGRQRAGPEPTDRLKRDLDELRYSFQASLEYLSGTALQNFIGSLSLDEVVLTFHITPATANVWVIKKNGVESLAVDHLSKRYSELQSIPGDMADMDLGAFNEKMEELGRWLIGPISRHLKKTIFFVPAGPLNGMPLDALRLNGRYLLEDHQVINLVTFPRPLAFSRLAASGDRRMFIAGFPQDYSGEYATSLSTSPEIQAVADFFIGPGLSIVQGAALLPDEFGNEAFSQADLIHLSMPGVLDVAEPGNSSLELSGFEGGAGRASLQPYDIRLLDLNADLVFLSNTRSRAAVPSVFASQLGLISDFAAAGAKAVIARTWRNAEMDSARFVREFYRRLLTTGDIAGSLTESRRLLMREGKNEGHADWAAYQLFVR